MDVVGLGENKRLDCMLWQLWVDFSPGSIIIIIVTATNCWYTKHTVLSILCLFSQFSQKSCEAHIVRQENERNERLREVSDLQSC